MLHVLVHREQYAIGPFATYGKALQCAAGLIERPGDRFSIVTTRPEDGMIHGWPYHDPYPVRSIGQFDRSDVPVRWYVVHHRPKGSIVVGPFADYRDAREEAVADLGLEDGSYGPLPCDVSIVEATIKDGRIGQWLVRAPRPID